MSNYMVEAKSRANLRSLARILREHLLLDDVLYFPIVELLDVMTELFDDFNYEVVEEMIYTRPCWSIQPFFTDRDTRSSKMPYRVFASAESIRNLSLVKRTLGIR